MQMSDTDLEDLRYAKELLENPGLAVKITHTLGTPIEKAFELLPQGWSEMVNNGARKALETAVNSALLTFKTTRQRPAANTLHKVMAAGLGAAGGFWGLSALGVELPASTTVMLRSIADIARSEDHDLNDPAIKMACVEVFALGGPSGRDDGAETGYIAIRAGLAKAINDAVHHITSKGLTGTSAPALVKLISQISSRFGIQVSEKVAAQSLPLLGAAGGAAINSIFIDHFQSMARGHFIVLRLERNYGADEVQRLYGDLVTGR